MESLADRSALLLCFLVCTCLAAPLCHVDSPSTCVGHFVDYEEVTGGWWDRPVAVSREETAPAFYNISLLVVGEKSGILRAYSRKRTSVGSSNVDAMNVVYMPVADNPFASITGACG